MDTITIPLRAQPRHASVLGRPVSGRPNCRRDATARNRQERRIRTGSELNKRGSRVRRQRSERPNSRTRDSGMPPPPSGQQPRSTRPWPRSSTSAPKSVRTTRTYAAGRAITAIAPRSIGSSPRSTTRISRHHPTGSRRLAAGHRFGAAARVASSATHAEFASPVVVFRKPSVPRYIAGFPETPSSDVVVAQYFAARPGPEPEQLGIVEAVAALRASELEAVALAVSQRVAVFDQRHGGSSTAGRAGHGVRQSLHESPRTPWSDVCSATGAGWWSSVSVDLDVESNLRHMAMPNGLDSRKFDRTVGRCF